MPHHRARIQYVKARRIPALSGIGYVLHLELILTKVLFYPKQIFLYARKQTLARLVHGPVVLQRHQRRPSTGAQRRTESTVGGSLDSRSIIIL